MRVNVDDPVRALKDVAWVLLRDKRAHTQCAAENEQCESVPCPADYLPHVHSPELSRPTDGNRLMVFRMIVWNSWRRQAREEQCESVHVRLVHRFTDQMRRSSNNAC